MDQAELKQHVSYDPTTGHFYRLPRPEKGKRWNARYANKQCCNDKPNRASKYIILTINEQHYQLHQLAWLYMTGRWPVCVIDHIDGDPTNNRWNNLREATHAQNNVNKIRKKKPRSGVTGVVPKGDKWAASINFNGKFHWLGVHDTLEEAAAARKEGEQRIHGEWVRQR